MTAALRGASLTIEIPLTQGAIAVVDAEDFHLVAPFTWRLHQDAYARTGTQQHTILMHRLILDAPDGIEVDHEDLDGLNNRRSNLRLATKGQNNANRLPRSSTGFKGVALDKRRGRYHAYIKKDRRQLFLGSFDTAVEAARAYDAAAREAFGEFARTNFEVAP